MLRCNCDFGNCSFFPSTFKEIHASVITQAAQSAFYFLLATSKSIFLFISLSNSISLYIQLIAKASCLLMFYIDNPIEEYLYFRNRSFINQYFQFIALSLIVTALGVMINILRTMEMN